MAAGRQVICGGTVGREMDWVQLAVFPFAAGNVVGLVMGFPSVRGGPSR